MPEPCWGHGTYIHDLTPHLQSYPVQATPCPPPFPCTTDRLTLPHLNYCHPQHPWPPKPQTPNPNTATPLPPPTPLTPNPNTSATSNHHPPRTLNIPHPNTPNTPNAPAPPFCRPAHPMLPSGRAQTATTLSAHPWGSTSTGRRFSTRPTFSGRAAPPMLAPGPPLGWPMGRPSKWGTTSLTSPVGFERVCNMWFSITLLPATLHS